MKSIIDGHSRSFGDLPKKALFIGEGNFIRAFAGTVIERANSVGKFNGSIVISPPRRWENCMKLVQQDYMYTVLERGLQDGKKIEISRIITSVSDCIDPVTDWQRLSNFICSENLQVIISNTTEAGIVYCKGVTLDGAPQSVYPARLAVLLWIRFTSLGAQAHKLLILPCELIESNGDKLRECVLQYAQDWKLGGDFTSWLGSTCFFANTLVDRIVTGFPHDEYASISKKLGYDDALLTACEPFLFWAIECPKEFISCFPVSDIGIDIVFADNIQKYRTRKVRLLNAAHTASVLAAYLCGHDTVGEMMADPLFNNYLRTLIFDEIIPATDLPHEELVPFANAVFDRFSNPFIKHRLLDISLNSVSKFNARCKDVLLDSIAKGTENDVIVFSLAALIYFYSGKDREREIRDSEQVREFMKSAWASENPALAVLSNVDFWGCSLSEIEPEVSCYIKCIAKSGMRSAVAQLLKKKGTV